MALSAGDIEDVVAIWEEWTAGKPFTLVLDPGGGEGVAGALHSDGRLLARLTSRRCCHLAIFHQAHGGELCVFSARLPADGRAVRFEVRALARVIGSFDPALAERERDQQP